MNKLRNKVFLVCFLILSVCLLGFIGIFNGENYFEQKKLIENNLAVASNNGQKADGPNSMEKPGDTPPKKPAGNKSNTQNENSSSEEQKSSSSYIEQKNSDETDDFSNIKFMDKIVYTLLLDENDNVKDVINHSNNETDNSTIKSIGNKILKSDKKEKVHIGCLYFTDYSYGYEKGNSLTIIDNSTIKSTLIKYLEISLGLFIVLEGIIFLIARALTKWIIKPVEQSFEQQKQFIADASHELKTPLSVIVATSEALEKNPGEKKWLDNIRNEANRMSMLINNLLELASTEKKEMYSLLDGNISKTIELSLLTFEGKAFENHNMLECNVEKNIMTKYDENSIKQLVEILLDNALKHAEKESAINVKLKSEDKNIILTVENKGKGIPKGEEEKIFQRFYRIDKSRSRKENRYGLGLAIAKNIVENHNGTISAKSYDGVTEFCVVLKQIR